MKTHNWIRNSAIVLSVMIMGCVLSGCAVQEPEGQVAARIAVVVDESGSFAENLKIASKIVAQFIRENALSGDTEIYLITMDREPRVIEKYDADQLLDAQGNKALADMKDNINANDGTDVVGSLRLATMKLMKKSDTKPSKLVLLCFSDMHVDPATTRSGKRNFAQLTDMDWKQLKDNSVDSRFYFVAPEMESELTSVTDKADLGATIKDPKESRRLVLEEVGDSEQ